MLITLTLATLLIVLGLLWAWRIADSSSHDDDAEIKAVFAVALAMLGAAVLLVTLLVLLARHVPWGWS